MACRANMNASMWLCAFCASVPLPIASPSGAPCVVLISNFLQKCRKILDNTVAY
ncbi:Uncharacterised protein [Bordetella pertussis]|nr:Uncharacterised protein [Bordetella pertussis]